MVGKTLGHYEILEPLGAGGMGEVYRARDQELRRDVAVKVLPAELASDPERLRRLEREAYLLASLNHPNIATIHGLERQGDVRYLVLELVEGRTLEQRLRGGALPPEEALEVGRQIAEALEVAHDSGIVHRDLKPGNVMITARGLVKVLDFGLARSVDPEVSTAAHTAVADVSELTGAAGTDSDTHLTTAGTVLGTAPYMSPEQIRADQLDRRSDNWAFGCVLFEMLAGRRAFDRTSIGDTLAAVLEQEPGWEHLPADLPDGIRSLLVRCLEKDRSRRLRDIADGRIEIENVLRIRSGVSSPGMVAPGRRRPAWMLPSMALAAAGVVAVALVAFNVGGTRDRTARWLGGPGGGAAGGAIDSLVILPLDNLSGDPERDFFAEGMTDELISRLTVIGGLKVISRTSAMSYKNAPKPLPVIGQELGVEAVVEGSVRENDDRVQIDLRLIRAATEERLWARSFERPLSEFRSLQNAMALALAEELAVELTPEEELRLSVAQSTDPRAIEEYMLGQSLFLTRTPQGFAGSIDHYQKALDIEPDFALANAGLAVAFSGLGAYLVAPPEQVFPASGSFAEAALRIDPDQVEAHVALGWLKMNYEWDWQAAEAEFREAVRVNPGSGYAHQAYGQMLVYAGRFEEGLAELRRGVELDPHSLIARKALAEGLGIAGQYDGSIAVFEGIIDADPTYLNAYLFGAHSLMRARNFEQAIAWAETADQLAPGVPFVRATRAGAYAVAGRREDALAIVTELERMPPDVYVDPAFIGWIYGNLGELDTAMEWIERGLANRTAMMIHLDNGVIPPLDGNPRFEEIQTVVGVNH